MPVDPYAVLGVRRDARPETIRRAYQRKARKHHPDANVGDETAAARFQQVQEAYQVLSDPTRRKQYDDTGSTEPIRADDIKAVLNVLVPRLQQIVQEAVHAGATKRKDLVGALRAKVRGELDDARRQIEALGKGEDGLRDAQKRFAVKDGENLLASVVASQLEGVAAQKKAAEAFAEGLQKAVEYLEGCSYRVDGTPGPYDGLLDIMAKMPKISYSV